MVTQKCWPVTAGKRISSGDQLSAGASPSMHMFRAWGYSKLPLWALWFSLLTHLLHFTVFFSLCPLAERGRQGVRDPGSAWQGWGCERRGRHLGSEVAFPSGGRGCIDVGSGMLAYPCARVMGRGAQPHRRQQNPLSMALHIREADPAPSPPALAQSVPHMPPLSRSLVDDGLCRGWSQLQGCGWPLRRGGRTKAPKSMVLWSR